MHNPFFCISLNDKLFLRSIQCRVLAYKHMFVACSKTGGLFIEHVNFSYVGRSSVIVYLNGQTMISNISFRVVTVILVFLN